MAYKEQRMQAGGWGGGGLPYATCHNQLFSLPQQKPYGLQRTADAGWGMGGGGYHMPPVTTGHLALTPQKLDSLQGTENAGWGLGGGTVGVGGVGGNGVSHDVQNNVSGPPLS